MNSLSIKSPTRKMFEDAQLVTVLENLSDGYMTLDEHWCFTFISPKCTALLQLPHDLIGKNMWEEFALLADSPFFDAAQKAVATCTAITVEEKCPYTGIWIESVIQPCADGVTIYYRDFTSKKLARDQQMRFEAIFAASPDFICIHDALFEQIYINRAGREILQLDPHETVKHLSLHPQWASNLILTKGIPTAMREGVWIGETALLRRDGTEIPVSQLIIAHKNESGEIEFISTMARDISEQKKSEQQLREQAALLDQSPDAIMVCDLQFRLLRWNHGATKMYGWTSDEVCGKVVPEFLCAETEEDKRAVIRQLLAQKGVWQGESKNKTKDQREVNTYSHWSVLRDADGHINSYLVIHSDITEQKKLQEQFLRSQRLESIGTLANGIAHDLNNVLSPILLATRILSLKFTDDDSQQLLSTLRRSAERGADLVRQVLTYVRGAEGERILFQPRHPIQEVSRILRETFPKNIEVEICVADDLWAINGDMTQLYQVLMNLCVNARDAMPNGGKLQVQAENLAAPWLREKRETSFLAPEIDTHNYVFIQVADTGVGIAPTTKTKIFEPFFTTKSHGQGTGLGLATVLGIIKSHQGVIDVESELGQGSKFKIYLPASSQSAIPAAKREWAELPLGKGETILVVDDEADILNMTSETLLAYGYKTLIANGGDEAISKFTKNPAVIDLVLVDMMMPRMDGVATIRALKRLNPSLKFITTSGLTDNSKIAEANALGASAFLAKPCLPGKMIQTIAAVLQH